MRKWWRAETFSHGELAILKREQQQNVSCSVAAKKIGKGRSQMYVL